MLSEVLARLNGLSDKEREDAIASATAVLANKPFTPNTGRQADAYLSEADVLYYGGAGGGGKTALLVGTAVNNHKSSIIFRRELAQTDGLERFGKELIKQSAGYNGSDHEWTWADGKSIKLAGMKEPDDWIKHAGRERDYMGFDEAPEMLEEQVASIQAWLRGPTGQRCRLILAGNPPRLAEGQWVKRWFAPWLDPKFPKPAKHGELRWAVHVDREIHWVDGPQEITINGEKYRPKSYTFVPALLSDNPFRDTDEYRAQLQSLPEPLRSQMLYGDFGAGEKDHESQLIPTAWIQAAQQRWTPQPPKDIAMTAMTIDPAGGGNDDAVLASRYGWWFSPLEVKNGKGTEDGSSMAAWIVQNRRSACAVGVDVGGGYGGAVSLRLRDNQIDPVSFDGAAASTGRTKDGKLHFANRRSEAWWKFREALDPEQEGGSVVALPPDPELLADLSAPRWTLGLHGIQVEPKITRDASGKVTGGLRKRLGRSPGRGDAVVMCLFIGGAAQRKMALGRPVKAVMGHGNQRRTIGRK